MGTRCNIKIETGDTTLWIYRHWDGYPAETGNDLARKLVNVKSADEFITKLINDDAYEVTTDQHGDIEYLYIIILCTHYTHKQNSFTFHESVLKTTHAHTYFFYSTL